jgi:hypothetical protein
MGYEGSEWMQLAQDSLVADSYEHCNEPLGSSDAENILIDSQV